MIWRILGILIFMSLVGMGATIAVDGYNKLGYTPEFVMITFILFLTATGCGSIIVYSAIRMDEINKKIRKLEAELK